MRLPPFPIPSRPGPGRIALAAALALGLPAWPAAGQSAPAAPDSSVEEILVTGSSVTEAVDQARFSENIVDVLSAEDFATTGDSSVVDALSRVTGVTTVGDKYVYVRGLGERYSATLFNGATLPSPDPVRRVIPLDLFPSAAMDQLSVQKTYAPWLPADFSGGSVQLSTRGVPTEREFHFDVELGTNTQATGTNAPWFGGGDADWTGFDDGFRQIPKGLKELEDGGPVSDAERQELGRSLERSTTEGSETIPPGFGMSGSWADSWRTGIGDLGVRIGAQGDNDWTYRRETRCQTDGRSGCTDPSGNSIRNNSKEQRTTNNVDYAALGSIDWEPAQSQLVKGTLFWTHRTEKRFDVEDPQYSSEAARFYRNLYSSWEEQSLITAQLSGFHAVERLRGLDLDWAVTWSEAKRDRPDSRFYGYGYFDDTDGDGLTGPAELLDTAGNTRTWEAMKDTAWDSALNASLPVKLLPWWTATVKAGGKYFTKDRKSDTWRFRYEFEGSDPSDYYGDSLDEIFSDDRIRPGYWVLRSFQLDADDYTATEDIGAGYLQLDHEIGDHLRLMGGARYESASQETVAPDAVNPVSGLDKKAFYPAVELTWILRDDLQLRAGWSRTINRPDLRELAEVMFINPENRFLYIGNSNLDAAEITNYDLRLEWYHGAGDSLEVAGFYKDMQNPIEEVTLPAAVRRRTWKNAEEAFLWGIEVAAQQGLAPLGRWADDFTLRANGAYIFSEVTDDPTRAPIATSTKHPLQGQSEWVINVQLTHDYIPWDLKNTLALNIFGERLSAVGSCPAASCGLGLGDLDEYEQPAPSLDYVMRWGFTLFDQDLGLTFKAKNLVNPEREWKRGDVTQRVYTEGRDFTLEVGYQF